MIIGFTGSQYGMTKLQKDAWTQLLRWLPVSAVRHGDCVGADEEAHTLYLEAYNILPIVQIHPSNMPYKRAWTSGGTIVHNPLPPLQRNKYIAGCVAGFRTDLLVAAPAQNWEILRSGTWATVRYARRAGTPIIILLP